ncbi:MAG: hypothetical protein LBT78_01155 [Tannerella sp.]|jgi:hypothetical protein|nr:hypothetical protein [Tannerella sp.]
MKGNDSKKEKKKEKSADGKPKALTDYQREKSSKQGADSPFKPKLK